MYCIENEFKQCIESIKKQTHQNFEYFIVQNLPNKEAHDKLYRTFMNKTSEFDLFIKVDADMVLARNTFFEEVEEKMQKEKKTEDLHIALHDYYTDSLIYGLHVYRNTVKWSTNDENIFVDRNTSKINVSLDSSELAPAAVHSPDPSPFQAFHFGLHKAIKVIQPDKNNLNRHSAMIHWNNVLKLYKHFKRKKDERLLLALCGSYAGLMGTLYSDHVDFNNPETGEIFEQYKIKIQEKKLIQLKSLYLFSNLFPGLSLEFLLFIRKKHGLMRALKNFFMGRFKQFKKANPVA